MYIDDFQTVNLKETQKVSLMNRVDKKFILNINRIEELFENIVDHYSALKVNDTINSQYQTFYFDTNNNDMYRAHHNGKLKRYKIRYRNYTSSGIGFLEIKLKNNKGRTIKSRIISKGVSENLSNEESNFINTNTPYNADLLSLKLANEFSRITLVNHELNERCTIDTRLSFSSRTGRTMIDNIAVVEVKSEKGNSNSIMLNELSRMGIKSSHFSKYCNGRVMVDTSLKHNGFKRRMRLLEKNLKQQIK